ncbi:hypothetical protein PAXINDRAFT_19155 [Paxillus involutus ATCC 200175]|uniref:Unplaced genomic scaffold PAXINscaffold_495, whole genome shotgun sequence n=1 Tax=Paxillus involutus ATCC 200175 TaxID=664439 RepID=A0A0C9TIE5_PAXIN|nr:hypothetical protein PAXINDRAFT_19155 [Paxillus involutus ATCC 200175]
MEYTASQATNSESTSGLASSTPFGLIQGRTLALPEASASKRSHSKVGDGEHATEGQQDASKEVDYNHVPLDRVAFITEPVVGFKSFGISFTANCMRGRSTTVFWVEDVVGNEPRYLGEQNGTLQRSPKNNDPHQNIELGLQQVHCYARDIRRAHHFLVALTVTRNELALLRGESSGTECLELALLDGRGCIELFRILLGIALAEGDDFGQNCDVDLATSPATTAPRMQVSYRESKATASSSQPHLAPASLSTHDTSQPVLSSSGLCVVDLQGASKLLALRMSWQDVEREAEQNDVLETSVNSPHWHANLAASFKSFKASRKNETCTTLGAIRAFLDHQLAGFPVKNRMLSVSLSELKRPVKYFWGVHDFVRGVRGALLGHQYLTSIGVLHRDISENNVVLARRPGEERGYLIDFDMAKLQKPEKPTEAAATVRTKRKGLIDDPGVARSSSPIPSDEVKPLKALRYNSLHVLQRPVRRETHPFR